MSAPSPSHPSAGITTKCVRDSQTSPSPPIAPPHTRLPTACQCFCEPRSNCLPIPSSPQALPTAVEGPRDKVVTARRIFRILLDSPDNSNYKSSHSQVLKTTCRPTSVSQSLPQPQSRLRRRRATTPTRQARRTPQRLLRRRAPLPAIKSTTRSAALAGRIQRPPVP